MDGQGKVNKTKSIFKNALTQASDKLFEYINPDDISVDEEQYKRILKEKEEVAKKIMAEQNNLPSRTEIRKDKKHRKNDSNISSIREKQNVSNNSNRNKQEDMQETEQERLIREFEESQRIRREQLKKEKNKDKKEFSSESILQNFRIEKEDNAVKTTKDSEKEYEYEKEDISELEHKENWRNNHILKTKSVKSIEDYLVELIKGVEVRPSLYQERIKGLRSSIIKNSEYIRELISSEETADKKDLIQRTTDQLTRETSLLDLAYELYKSEVRKGQLIGTFNKELNELKSK